MKCKELADEYGLTAMRIGKMRRSKWKKHTGDLTEEQVAYIRGILDRQQRTDMSIEEFKPEPVNVVITHKGNLPRYMECMKRGEPGRFHLLMPFGSDKKNFSVGQQIQAVKVKHEGRELYIHSALSRKQWEYVQ